MNALDWVIILIYLSAMIGLASSFGRHASGQSIGAGDRAANRRKQDRRKELMKVLDAAQRNPAGRIAVVGRGQGQVVCFFRSRVVPLLPVLNRHLDRRFDRGGTIAAEEHVRQIPGRDFDQPVARRSVVSQDIPNVVT